MIIAPGFAHASFFFTGSGVPLGAACTLGLEYNPAKTVQQTADDCRDNFVATILPVLIQNTGLDHVLVKYGPNDVGPTATSASGVGGSDLSDQAPPNVAYLVRKGTALGGRKNRGRMYLPGVDEGEVLQGGTIQPGKLAGVEAAVDAFMAAMIADGHTLVVLHNGPEIPTEITSLTVDGTVATQRRRLRR
jgi:hypothetical protein